LFAGPGDHLKHCFIEHTAVAFGVGQENQNEFKESCQPLKHQFIEFIEVAFCAGQVAGNEFAVPGDLLKHSFLDFNQVAFCSGQQPEMGSVCHASQ